MEGKGMKTIGPLVGSILIAGFLMGCLGSSSSTESYLQKGGGNGSGGNGNGSIGNGTLPLLPDLIIRSITFKTYGGNNTNGTNATKMVNVTTRVENIGKATAGNSTTDLVRINATLHKPTPPIAAGGSYVITDAYACTKPHTYAAIADARQQVTEISEYNNVKAIFVTC